MTWSFVGRRRELDLVTTASGPVLVTGEPGIGRSALLHRSTERVRRERGVEVLWCDGPGGMPYAPFARFLPEQLTTAPASARTAREVSAALTRRFAGRQPVFVLDDAHLVHHAAVRVLREVYRLTGAPVLVSVTSGANRVPDTVACLRYEPGFRVVKLEPLTTAEVVEVLARTGVPVSAEALRMATGGNPALLRDLVVENDVKAVRRPLFLREEGNYRLLDAVTEAWHGLDLDRLAELCVLALRAGHATRVAHIWSIVLLLRGEAALALDFLDRIAAPEHADSQLRLARAMVLSVGLDRMAEANSLLRHSERTRAHLAWLLAVTGRTTQAAAVLSEPATPQDLQSTVFARAANGLVALAGDQPAAAVAHLRRAVAGAERLQAELPWLAPVTVGHLIDALLLAGRVGEATTTALELHVLLGGRAWDVTVGFSTLARTVPAHAATADHLAGEDVKLTRN